MSGKQKPARLHHYIITGVLIALAGKLFLFDVLRVEGSSMEPTLCDGDKILVCKVAYGIVNPFGSSTLVRWRDAAAGDVVVYLRDNNLVVKRCVAVAGERIEITRDSGYTLKAGGKTFGLTGAQYDLLKNTGSVPEGTVLAIGDNYETSVDSRAYGFVLQKNILGKVIFVDKRP